MKKGVVPVLLYLTAIIISAVLGFQEHVISGLVWILLAGVGGLAGFFITNWGIKKNPGLLHIFSPNSKEHTIMPIFWLFFLFIGNIICLFSPEIGSFVMSQNSSYISLAVGFSSLALGEIYAYTRFHSSTDEPNSE